MCALIVVAFASAMDFYDVKNELQSSITLIMEYALEGEAELAAMTSELILAEWLSEEVHLLRYLNHSDIDTVTDVLSKLPYTLRDPYSYGDALGELNKLYHFVNHLWESELPYFRSII